MNGLTVGLLHCGERTIGAEDGGCHRTSCAQQLPAHSLAKAAHILSKQGHSVAFLVQHCVAVGLLKAQNYCTPACSSTPVSMPGSRSIARKGVF